MWDCAAVRMHLHVLEECELGYASRPHVCQGSEPYTWHEGGW